MNTTAISHSGRSLAAEPVGKSETQGDFQAKFAAAAKASTPQEELSEYLKKSPAEHMRDAILDEMGLTEEKLAAMPPEQRAAIEKTIAAKVKERMTGLEGSKPSASQTLSTMLSMLGKTGLID